MIDFNTIAYSLLAGMIPAIIWLIFWLREDYKHPEPRQLILKTFFFGMVAVILVLPFQKMVDSILPGAGALAIFLWVVLEELFKFAAAWLGGLSSREDNEPIDPIIYMITAALGFVALENALFLFSPILGQELVKGVITGNLRFIGASLLHVVSSGLVGVSLALSFYKPFRVRVRYALYALTLAITFHTAFNLSILNLNNSGALLAFAMVWMGVIALLALFERVKQIAHQ